MFVVSECVRVCHGVPVHFNVYVHLIQLTRRDDVFSILMDLTFQLHLPLLARLFELC